jgi:ribosomal protein S18 acetylase RimI-like enzyme
VNVIEAKSSESVEAAEALFREYASTLDFDLSFQHFDDEMKTFPIQYSPPSGCLLLAYEDETVAGCVGLRMLDEGICEMKRLYVRPEFRGKGIGRALVLNVIDRGRKLGYGRMRLDTVPSMHEAIALYESFGFKQIPQYRDNPVPGALYFELQLRESD